MRDIIPSGQDAVVPATSRDLAAPLDILRIDPDLARIAEERSSSHERLRGLLTYLLQLTNGRGIAFHDYSEGDARLRELVWPEPPPTEQEAFSILLEDAALEVAGKRATVIRSPAEHPGHHTVSVPLVHAGRTRGCVGLILVAADLNELQPFVVILQTALGFLHYTFLREEVAEGMYAIEQTSALVELTTLAAGAPYFEESLRIMADEMQRHLGCHRAALGLATRGGIRLASLSGTAQFDPRGTAAHVIEGAMREAVLHQGPVRRPRSETDTGRPDLSDVAHQELQRLLDLSEVHSIPLRRSDGKIFAVLTLMWRADQPPVPATRRFLEAATPHLGAVLAALKQADPANSRKWWHHLWGKITHRRRAIILGAAVGLVLILAWPIAQSVRVECQIQPVLRRVVSAPFDGIFKKSLAEPGQSVARNELLAVLDDKELQWKHAELLAARDRALRQRDLSMTDSEAAVALAQMAQLEADSLQLEITLIEHHKANLELRSPIDGIVLTGDLQRAEGAPVKLGQVLYEIGPTDRMIVELRIPAHDISLIREGAEVRVRLASFPGRTWQARIRTIRPQSESIDGRNIFIAEANIQQDGETTEMRAGMKGRASIQGPHAPLAWMLTRRLWDFLHQFLFW